MKKEYGITLISLTVYIISMLIVISIIAVITTYFYRNVNTDTKNIDIATQFTKFNSFFVKEINTENIEIQEIEDNYIVFDNGVQYTFIKENNSIYRNNIRIVSNINEAKFFLLTENNKYSIEVIIKIENETKNEKYTLASSVQ